MVSLLILIMYTRILIFSCLRGVIMDKHLLKESRVHGDAMYPISIYTIPCNCHYIFHCHWHNEQEFLFCTEGSALFQVGTSYYEVAAGEGLYIPAEELHAAHSIDYSSYTFSAVVFSSELLHSSTYDVLQGKYIDPLVNRQYIFPVHIKGIAHWEKEMLILLREIVEINEQKCYGHELETKGRLYLVLSKLLANSYPSTHNSEHSKNTCRAELLKTVLHYIQSNYQDKIRLGNLASLVNMSDGHFCRFFKKIMNRTPVDYLNCFRVQKAAMLLKNSDKKIYEIALDVGFDSFSHFIAIFRKYMGCTPSKYRQKVLSA